VRPNLNKQSVYRLLVLEEYINTKEYKEPPTNTSKYLMDWSSLLTNMEMKNGARLIKWVNGNKKPYTKKKSGTLVREKETIIREIVQIRCPYCGTLHEETQGKCPNCGASA